MNQNPADNPDQMLWETVQRLHAIVEASPLAIIALDADGLVKMWNRGAERIFGWSENEVVGRALPTVPPEFQDEFRTLVLSQMQGRGGLAGFETTRMRKDGALIDVSIWTSPLRDSTGNISGIMSVAADITDRKRADKERSQLVAREQAARAEASLEKRYQKLLESAPDAILEVDRTGCIVLLN